MSINGVMTLPPVIPVPSAMPPFSVFDIRKRIHAIQEVMKGVMKEGTHFGTIPGTPKPSLWKAGAEVLCMTFRLAPLLESHVTVDDPDAEWSYTATKRDGKTVSGTCIGFFEVESICTIQGMNGEMLSRCSARCNNREAKYRGLSVFEIRNTILKMSEKRAFVSAILMATGASDIFTQDIEDFPELVEGHVIQSGPAQRTVDVSAAPLARPSPPSSSSAERIPRPIAGSNPGHGLTSKQEAWLMRVGEESNTSPEIMTRCLAFLRDADSGGVKAFFDDLSRQKGGVFHRFMAEAS